MMKKKNYKPCIIGVIALIMILFLTCCTKKHKNTAKNLTLSDIVEKLYRNVNVPPYETITLNEENFEFYAFVPYSDGMSAVAADALVNITPHSMVVIKTENGNGKELAEEIAENADLNKWLCVGSEKGCVAYTDHYVVLVMSDKATADAITDNFRAISKDLDNMEMNLLTMSNPLREN